MIKDERLEQQEVGDAEIKQMLNDIEYYQKRIEELEQPLTRDWKETIDERIANDDKFKKALAQPAQEPVAIVYSMQDGYIGQMVFKDEALKMALEALETPSLSRGDPRLKAIQACKEALEQPAQEPVGWINVKDKLPPQEINFLSLSETFGYQVSMYSSNPLNSTGLPTLERLKITKWMPIPHITHPAPSWQGLSNDKIREIGDNCLEKNNGLFNWIDFARAIEQALKEKNTQ